MKKSVKIIISVICVVLVITILVLSLVYKTDIWGNGVDNVNRNSYGKVRIAFRILISLHKCLSVKHVYVYVMRHLCKITVKN